VQGSGLRVQGAGFRAWGLGFRLVEFGVVRLVLLEDLHGALGHLDLEHQEVLHLAQQAHLTRGGLVFKAHRLVYHSTIGLIVIKKKTKTR